MRSNLVQFAFIVAATVLAGAIEDLAPAFNAAGAPLLLALALFLAAVTRTPVWTIAAVAAGAFEEAVAGLPPGTAIVFFAAAAWVVHLARGAVAPCVVAAFPVCQIWLALVLDGAGALARVLLSVPAGALVAALVFAVLSRIWKGVGADA